MWPEAAGAIGLIIDFDRTVVSSVKSGREHMITLHIAGVAVRGPFPRVITHAYNDSVARWLTTLSDDTNWPAA